MPVSWIREQTRKRAADPQCSPCRYVRFEWRPNLRDGSSVEHNNVCRAGCTPLLHASSLIDWIDDLTCNSDHLPSF